MSEQRWITVFEGPAAKAAFLRGLLESHDIDCVVPDELTKLVDPFITGANPFQVRLQVREADALRAGEVLTSAAVPAGSDDADGNDAGPPSVEADQDDEVVEAAQAASESALDRPALRTMLLTVLVVTAPLALLSFALYLRDCRRRGARSSLHVGVWLAAGIALAVVIAAVVHLATPKREEGPWAPGPPPEPPWRTRPPSPIGPR